MLLLFALFASNYLLHAQRYSVFNIHIFTLAECGDIHKNKAFIFSLQFISIDFQLIANRFYSLTPLKSIIQRK